MKGGFKYFISFIIEVDEEIFIKNNNKKFVGIDANIGHFNISEKILSRKQKESNKYFKTKTKLQNIYYKIYNIQTVNRDKNSAYNLKIYAKNMVG